MKISRQFLAIIVIGVAYLTFFTFGEKTGLSGIILAIIFSFLAYKLASYIKKKKEEKARKAMIYSFKKSYDKFAVKKKNSD
jgi:hypothetical protein